MNPEHIKPYTRSERKGAQVRSMFNAIAPTYDVMNTVMTAGLHRRWRDVALRSLGSLAGKNVLDVATGTGDLAFRLYERFGAAAVTGIDLSEGMLDIARRKLAAKPQPERDAITFRTADCLALPFPDSSFDAVTVAYGVRNFERLAL